MSRWVKPRPINPAVPGGFTIDDFTVSTEAGTVTCPNGVTRPVNHVRQVNFGVACRGCPLRDRCTRSATGKAMRIREHDALQRAPPGPRRRPGVPGPLPATPPDGRTVTCVDHPGQPAVALPRHREEQRLAAAASRSHQPPPPPHPRTAAHPQRLGPRELTEAGRPSLAEGPQATPTTATTARRHY